MVHPTCGGPQGPGYRSGMFPRAVRVVRLRGVDVRLDPTWLLVAVFVVWSLHVRYAVGERPAAAALAMAVAGTIGFFGSVLAHELGHALEARHRGLEVHGITLFLFGGVTEMDLRLTRPREEFTIAAVGPWVSLVLASVFGLAAAALDWYVPTLDGPAAVAGLLGWLNLGLALFNIVPGAPLDGGRVLRAVLWRVTGDRARAMLLAARAGQLVAAALVGAAVWFGLPPRSQWFAALWIGAIGLFLLRGASAEYQQGVALADEAPA